MVRIHPQYAYWDVPNMVGTLALGSAVAECLALARAIPPAAVGIWAGLMVSSEFAVERFQVRSHHSGLSAGAALEAAVIRISSDLGRFPEHLSWGDMPCVFRRFDYMGTGEWKPLETRFTRAKFALFSASAPLAYWLGLMLG